VFMVPIAQRRFGPHVRAAHPQLSRRGGLLVRASPPRMPNSC
jgi:hypothetical protein